MKQTVEWTSHCVHDGCSEPVRAPGKGLCAQHGPKDFKPTPWHAHVMLLPVYAVGLFLFLWAMALFMNPFGR